MAPLGELLPALPSVQRIGPADQPITSIEYWIGDVTPGALFVAIGDGHERIGEAIAAGARAILCERLPGPAEEDVTYLIVPNSIVAMGLLAQTAHGSPSERLRVVGVTGTNGKTTTATLLHRLLRGLRRGAGLLSNIRDYVNDEWSEARYTTGHALFLAEAMARMASAECGYCFMEVSSQGIEEQRLAGIAFDGAIFTNLSRDHLNYHGTMDNYAAAKKAWFDRLPASAFALTNIDDPRGLAMVRDTAARRLSYGTQPGSDYRFRIAGETLDGLVIEIDGRRLRSRLLGAFNAYNVVACYAAACELGEDPGEVAAALETLAPVEGRMQAIRGGDGRTAIVDYAHTPDAVDKVLRHLRASSADDARIITVMGCGGGGDVSRRPVMAATAAALSDRLILTTDNARWEDPDAIIASMIAGIDGDGRKRTTTIADRRAAIEKACAEARPGDLVLIAGKGHERHQEIGGIRHPFDDAAVARAALGR